MHDVSISRITGEHQLADVGHLTRSCRFRFRIHAQCVAFNKLWLAKVVYFHFHFGCFDVCLMLVTLTFHSDVGCFHFEKRADVDWVRAVQESFVPLPPRISANGWS